MSALTAKLPRSERLESLRAVTIPQGYDLCPECNNWFLKMRSNSSQGYDRCPGCGMSIKDDPGLFDQL